MKGCKLRSDLWRDGAEKEDLNVNSKKTTLVPYTWRRKLPKFQSPTILGSKVSVSIKVKYLGVNLDAKLTCKSHQEHITNKAAKAF